MLDPAHNHTTEQIVSVPLPVRFISEAACRIYIKFRTGIYIACRGRNSNVISIGKT